jgi:hypothetical protein
MSWVGRGVVTCRRCNRRLFLDRRGRVPAHGIPPVPVTRGRDGRPHYTPLPMPIPTWCPGSNESIGLMR